MREVLVRGVECRLYESDSDGILQIAPPFGPYTTVTAIFNPRISTAKNEALKALIRRATIEWTGIERFNV